MLSPTPRLGGAMFPASKKGLGEPEEGTIEG